MKIVVVGGSAASSVASMKKPLSSLCRRTVAVTLMSAILRGTFATLAAAPRSAAKAGRITGGEELFGVRAGPVGAGRREVDVVLAVGTGGFTFTTGGSAGGFCLEYGHGAIGRR